MRRVLRKGLGTLHSPHPQTVCKQKLSSARFVCSYDISVVIVSWNTKLYLEECLESLAAAPPRRSMEIIVVDNASTTGLRK